MQGDVLSSWILYLAGVETSKVGSYYSNFTSYDDTLVKTDKKIYLKKSLKMSSKLDLHKVSGFDFQINFTSFTNLGNTEKSD